MTHLPYEAAIIDTISESHRASQNPLSATTKVDCLPTRFPSRHLALPYFHNKETSPQQSKRRPRYHSAAVLSMPPARKKTKISTGDDRPSPSALLSDCRAGWLVKSDEQSVEISVKNETLVVHRDVLTRNSEYFRKCLTNMTWPEARNRNIVFDDIEAKFLALFIGVAYSHSSIIPLQPPMSIENPEARSQRTPLRDFVEVYKLCDRFVAPEMGDYLVKCIKVAIGDGHRAVFRAQQDVSQQRAWMKDFADGYEALEMNHTMQKELGELMTTYFCEGINFATWAENLDDMSERPKFLASVSGGFAKKLADLVSARRLKRKERPGPYSG